MTDQHTKQMAKALDAKREAWLQLEILEGLGRDPSFERDVAFDAWSDADAKWRSIIRTEWDLRAMERHIPHVGMTAITAELGGVI